MQKHKVDMNKEGAGTWVMCLETMVLLRGVIISENEMVMLRGAF